MHRHGIIVCDVLLFPDTYYDLQHRQRKGYLLAKRILDVVISILGLAVCFLPMLIISLMIKLDSPGPAIYLHQRIGQNGKPLPLLKFRSMCINADEMTEVFTPE